MSFLLFGQSSRDGATKGRPLSSPWHAEASVSSGAQEMPAPDDFGEQGQNAVWASVRECSLSPTGSVHPDRVTIEWRQK